MIRSWQPAATTVLRAPRYSGTPFEKTEAELRRTAELWYRIGYRDSIVTNEEIACRGCTEDTRCRYGIVKCVRQRQLENCGQCAQYPCQTVKDCYAVTGSFVPACRAACTETEFAAMQRAFFEKEQNLESSRETFRHGIQGCTEKA